MSALNAGLLLSEEATRRQRGITGDIESGAPEVKAQKYLMPLRHLACRAGRLCPRRVSDTRRSSFPLTLRDVFNNTHVLDVTPQTKIFEVKELLRVAKKAQVQTELAFAKERLAQMESAMARDADKDELAREAERLLHNQSPLDDDITVSDVLDRLAVEKLAAAEQVARLEAQAREVLPRLLAPPIYSHLLPRRSSIDYLDALVLLYNGEALDDDGTVGSHGLSRETVVGLSMQDPAKGRQRRRERLREARAAERKAKLKKAAAAGAVGAAFVLSMILMRVLTQKWAREAGEFSPTNFFQPAQWRLGDMVMRSWYNGALVQAVTYMGEATALSWELQHSLCAAAGRVTPGSDLSGSSGAFVWSGCSSRDCQDKFCAYSSADNHVVTSGCGWARQDFTHVSGTLGGGVGYMCAYIGCGHQVRVEGTAAAAHGDYQDDHPTLNSGDAVFCSP
eukprot:COSAG04_NODE_3024_length_3267_cov_2.198548_4_plen_450_part_00